MNYSEREYCRRKRGRARIRVDFSRDRSTRSISIRMWRSKARVEYNEYVNIRRGARGTLSLVNSGVRVTGGVLSVSPGVASVSSLVTLDNGTRDGGGPRRCNVGGRKWAFGPRRHRRHRTLYTNKFLTLSQPTLCQHEFVCPFVGSSCVPFARVCMCACVCGARGRGTCMAQVLKVNDVFLRSLVTAR